jgi:hypothetical protein
MSADHSTENKTTLICRENQQINVKKMSRTKCPGPKEFLLKPEYLLQEYN